MSVRVHTLIAAAMVGTVPELVLAQATTSLDAQRASIEAQLASSGATQQTSIQKQLESAEKQRSAAVPQAAPLAPPAIAAVEPAQVQPVCDALDKDSVSDLILSASRDTGIGPDLLKAVMEQESAFKPCAVSTSGAKGLMQLMPAVIKDFEVDDPFDPEQNVTAGSKFLKQLLTRFGGDVRTALAAYNAGPNRIGEDGAIPNIPETQKYVESILKKLGLN